MCVPQVIIWKWLQFVCRPNMIMANGVCYTLAISLLWKSSSFSHVLFHGRIIFSTLIFLVKLHFLVIWENWFLFQEMKPERMPSFFDFMLYWQNNCQSQFAIRIWINLCLVDLITVDFSTNQALWVFDEFPVQHWLSSVQYITLNFPVKQEETIFSVITSALL